MYSIRLNISSIIFSRNDGDYFVNWINIPYIDDCTVYGNMKEELISSLHSNFDRFKLDELFLKASISRISICKFEYPELDFGGKVTLEEDL